MPIVGVGRWSGGEDLRDDSNGATGGDHKARDYISGRQPFLLWGGCNQGNYYYYVGPKMLTL